MAKKSLIQREKKRQKLEKKYHLIRGSLKKKIRSKVSPLSLSHNVLTTVTEKNAYQLKCNCGEPILEGGKFINW